ncbi:hypothetical protein ONE63_007745 [Megalurothrips usitatus]|uniref:Serine protease snake-like n=1 Tax=Megalurothrips usitatus TaxID=439358 RepID=A0AAV7XNM0_9NEOP|nr:hypothetical protein ONE63_007745 [Megalurothrips usitatus]
MSSAAGAACTDASGLRGVCALLTECPSARQKLEHDEYPEICSYLGMIPVVCCTRPEEEQHAGKAEQNSNQTATKKQTDPVASPPQNATADDVGSIAAKKCAEYAKFVFVEDFSPTLLADPIVVDSCAISVDALVVGGEHAKPKEFPHMAAIGFEKDGEVRYRCGGSLISPDFVLTAAHCSDRTIPATWVLLGDLDKSTDADEAAPQTIAVAERIKYPDYKPPVRYHDIALLRLESAAEMTAFVRPACLHTEPTLDPSRDPVQIGWGRTAYQWFPSDRLLKATLALADHRTCAKAYAVDSKANMPAGILDELQVCAGGDGHSACQGDSGGPLQLGTTGPDEPYCMYKVVGLSSFGIGCSTVPGVYTRVYFYVPWIESIVWPGEDAQTTDADDEEGGREATTSAFASESSPTSEPGTTAPTLGTAEPERNDLSREENRTSSVGPDTSPPPKTYPNSNSYPVWA